VIIPFDPSKDCENYTKIIETISNLYPRPKTYTGTGEVLTNICVS
jgi:hypothetical protein